MKVRRQVKMKYLLNNELLSDLSERGKKETVDLVIYFTAAPLVVRVQDSHHRKKHYENVDRGQRHLLEMSGNKVLDIWLDEFDYNDENLIFRTIENARSS